MAICIQIQNVNFFFVTAVCLWNVPNGIHLLLALQTKLDCHKVKCEKWRTPNPRDGIQRCQSEWRMWHVTMGPWHTLHNLLIDWRTGSEWKPKLNCFKSKIVKVGRCCCCCCWANWFRVSRDQMAIFEKPEPVNMPNEFTNMNTFRTSPRSCKLN